MGIEVVILIISQVSYFGCCSVHDLSRLCRPLDIC